MVNRQRLHYGAFNRAARIEGRIRVLENDLHFSPDLFHFSAGHFGYVPAFKPNAPGIRLFQSQNEFSQGGFSTSGFSDQTKRFTPMIQQIYVIYSPDKESLPLKKVWPERKLLTTCSRRTSSSGSQHVFASCSE